MPEAAPSQSPYRFGVFELDPVAGELRKRGLRVRLQDQPIRVLLLLVQRPGEVVTRDEIQKALWPGNTFVDFDHGLNKAISKIREALSDSAESPRFVETVARRGYRFLAEVKTAADSPLAAAAGSPTAEPGTESVSSISTESPNRADLNDRAQGSAPAASSSSQIFWKVLALLLVLALAGVAAWRYHARNSAAHPIRSLAVLPLESLSNDASQDYFADGMTDQLISDLGQISALRVISRTSVMSYKHVRKPLPQIAQELGVDAIIEGTVLRSGDNVRITAQLIDAASDKHLWSRSYEGELRDALNLQNKVAAAIADQIRVNLNAQEQTALSSVRVVKPSAYESFLKGRFFWNKRTASGLNVALAYFNQAIEDDPKYAEAYSGLADTYALLGDWQYAVMSAKEALPKAKTAATKAIELNDSLGEAHNSLAFVLDGYDWDFEAGGREFRRAIELNPGYATAHHWYAWHLSLVGQHEEAIAEMRKAVSLDPLSLVINSDLAELLLLAHSYDESIAQSRKTIEMDPNFALAHNQLAQAYLAKQQIDDAIAEFHKAVEVSGGENPICVANLARAYAAAGKKDKAEELLEGLMRKSSPNQSHAAEIAMIYASLGQNDEAMKWLQKGYDERFNPGVLLRPGFDTLRSDPRFVALVHLVGLP
jgi:TolB-like protein/DNA-binding winged helix-turn-helix (wHTH) protein/Tfp pilus assembly protein PilF